MSQFDMLKETNDNIERLNEMVELFSANPELLEFFDDQGKVIEEDIKKFIDDARQFIKHGTLSHYNRKPDSDKEDENENGETPPEDTDDVKYYFTKMIAGLVYYMKKNLKKADAAAFNQIAKGISRDGSVDGNVKSMGEKFGKKWAMNLGDKFATKPAKDMLSKYIDDIEAYFLGTAPAEA